MSDTVSVAMAVYEGAAHLSPQLVSLAAQTRLPDELIVADDGSRDDGLAIVERFAADAPFPVRIVRHAANIGILENFHSAFAAARGSIILYCDQDDVWRPDKIATMLARFTPATMLVMHQSALVDAALVPLGRTAPGNARYGRFAWPADSTALHGFGHQMGFRRAVLDQMRRLRPIADDRDPGGLAHDLDRFIPFCSALLGEVVLLRDPLVQFRRHAAATSPAGQAVEVARDRHARIAYLVTRDADRSALHASIVIAAAARGALLRRSGVLRLMHAYRGAADAAAARAAILSASNTRDRLRARVTALSSVIRLGAFTNPRRLRAIGLACIAGVSARRPLPPPPTSRPAGAPPHPRPAVRSRSRSGRDWHPRWRA